MSIYLSFYIYRTTYICLSIYLGKDVQSKWNEVKTLVPQRDQTLQVDNIDRLIGQTLQ